MTDSVEGAAIRQLVHTIAEDPPEDAEFIDVVHEALDDYEELREDHRRLQDRLAEIETQLDAIQDLGREKTTKEEKITAIVRYAQNTADGDGTTGRVALTVKTLRGLTGISRRYAYDYIDDLPHEFEWLHNRNTIDQYGSLEIARDGPDRALIVDLEVLHNDEQAVNKFTTRTTGKEASA